MQIFVRSFKDESGVTAIEYSLVAGLISVACIAGITAVGNSLLGIYTTINTALGAAF